MTPTSVNVKHFFLFTFITFHFPCSNPRETTGQQMAIRQVF